MAGLIFLLTAPAPASAAGPAAGNEATLLAITIDDPVTQGPLPSGRSRVSVMKAITSALLAAKVPGAYAFITSPGSGSSEDQPEIVKNWVKAGYSFGNHTATHLSLNKVSIEEFFREISDNETLLRRISSREDWKLFRYPYLHEGNTKEKREAVRNFLHRRGYRIAPVTMPFSDHAWYVPYARCLDKRNKKGAAKMREKFIEQAIRAFRLGQALGRKAIGRNSPQVWMFHAGPLQADTLPAILEAFSKEGAKFVSLQTVMADPALNRDSGYVSDEPKFYYQQFSRTPELNFSDVKPPPPAISQAEIASLCD